MRYLWLVIAIAWFWWMLKSTIRDAITDATKVSDRELERAVRRNQEWSKDKNPITLPPPFFGALYVAIIVISIGVLSWGR